MAILGRYRDRRRNETLPLRRVWTLSILLCLVVMVVLITAQRRLNSTAGSSETPESPAATAPPDAPPPGPPPPSSTWRLLPPDEERALLSQIVDQVPLGVREHREAYYYLINKVHRLTDAQLAEELDPEVTYFDYAKQPEIIRGSVVEVSGMVMRLEMTPLDPSKAGLAAVYEGQIMDRKSNIYSFVLTEPPAPPFAPGRIRVRNALRARLRGIFMQILVYGNREVPPKDVATPLIIGRRLERLKVKGLAPPPVSWGWIAVLGVGALVLSVWLCIRIARPSTRRPHTSREAAD